MELFIGFCLGLLFSGLLLLVLGIWAMSGELDEIEKLSEPNAKLSFLKGAERVKDKLQRLVRRSKCKHCGQPIRKIKCEFGNIWVHDDPDEHPDAEDYGWVKCLPNADGSFEDAEPNAESEASQ